MFKIAIVGRANVGKTTLFNKMFGKSVAITHNLPGVTRDRKEAKIKFGDIDAVVYDTAGIENAQTASDLTKKAMEQSMVAVDECDICLLIVDAQEGINEIDKFFARLLHKKNKQFILVLNKSESIQEIDLSKDFYSIGAKTAVGISAEHGMGFDALYESLYSYYKIYTEKFDTEQENWEDAIKVAIIGRPNVGKSTLTNKLLQQERVIVDGTAGTTRDSIATNIIKNDIKFQIIDTAGIRKKMNIDDNLEDMSVTESFRAIDFAHVVILMISIESLLEKQDIALLDRIMKEGRGLMIIINKCDLIKKEKVKKIIKELEYKIENLEYKYCIGEFFTLSAKTDAEVDDIFVEAKKIYDKWQEKISTSKLNKWLQEEFLLEGNLGSIKHRPIKCKFINQITTRPPTFAISSNFANWPDSAVRRIRQALVEKFSLYGVPVRILIKKADNPFANIANKQDAAKNTKRRKYL